MENKKLLKESFTDYFVDNQKYKVENEELLNITNSKSEKIAALYSPKGKNNNNYAFEFLKWVTNDLTTLL